MVRHTLAVCAILAISGCAYTVPTDISPATNIYSNYSDKVPGRFALFVDADEMAGEFKVSGLACSAHTYPVDARSAFIGSVQSTMENIVDEFEIVPRPMDVATIQSRNLQGMILVEVQDLDIDLTVIPGFWSQSMEADAEVTVSLVVGGPSGRLLGTRVEGDDDYKAESGGACEGGAIAIGRAVEEAMKEALERLGEKFSNSPRIRNAS